MVCFPQRLYFILSNLNLALRVIHKAGWVHRDLSPANLYLYKDPETNAKRGIIGDLEFAKKVGTGASSDVRTVCVSDFDCVPSLILLLR